MAGLLADKVALVTGGSSGIGRATALAFAREGAKVVIADIAVEGGEETVRMIKEAGGDAIFVQTDVRRAEEVEALINLAVETYGRIDCAFNNAGIAGKTEAPIADYPEEEWLEVLSTNLTGVWLCMKYEIRQMLKQGGGVIVNNASAAGLLGFPGRSPYGASKHGVLGITKTAALEYAQAGIRVNAVCPGWIQTPMIQEALDDPERGPQIVASEPLGRVGTSEEVAEAVVWLCSDKASFVIGHGMVIDGGLTII
jgi:NAD(P)-dependent dehydrogenase (short-subunit alcohol dehydrogenase family)